MLVFFPEFFFDIIQVIQLQSVQLLVTMLEASQWAGPPPMAAQPMGIQSTAGAVPVVNEKGMQ